MQQKIQGGSGGNAYAPRFKQGATIVPCAFYFIEPQGGAINVATDVSGRVVNIRTHPLALEGAKKPWDGISLTGQIQGRYLYRTALARNVVPFAMLNPPVVALPLVADGDDNDDKGADVATLAGARKWRLLDSAELTERGDIEAARWFNQCEKLWDERRSDSAKKQKASLTDWLDWQSKLTQQPVNAKWAVMYTASGTDASAVALDICRDSCRLLADHETYMLFVTSEDEARFVEGYLNCGYVNRAIKEFQSRGLFGPRDVHKKILELPWPEFSRSSPSHRQLVALGNLAAQAVQDLLGTQQDLELDPHSLARLRTRIRAELAPLMGQIDELVEAISTGKDLVDSQKSWQQLLRNDRPTLPGADSAELSVFLQTERQTWRHREPSIDKGRECRRFC